MRRMLNLLYLLVRHGTGFRIGIVFPLVLALVVLASLTENQCLNFSLLRALLLNLVNNGVEHEGNGEGPPVVMAVPQVPHT